VTARRRSERPTVPPSFDVLQYAKDSEARMRRSAPPTAAVPAHSEPALELDFEDWLEATPRAQSEVRLMTHPNPEAPADEAWARAMVGAPFVLVAEDELTGLSLDDRTGFLLSQMDGVSDLETVIATSAIPREEALRLARDLFESGIVAFTSGS
jgi:hypothetical protein